MSTQNNLFDSFTHKYGISKTIRFGLKPMGRTMETMKEKFLPNDKARAEAYPVVKKILDEEHKALLERVFSKPIKGIDWDDLAQAYEACRESHNSEKTRKTLAAKQEALRKQIVKLLKGDEAYSNLTAATPDKVIADIKRRYEAEGKELPEELQTFHRFASYFLGYQENRNNIYSTEEKKTAAAYRAVNENFEKFEYDVRTYKYISDNYPQICADAEKELASVLNGERLCSLFVPSAYGTLLAQSRIDFFNAVLGGFAKDGEKKFRGLNEFMNLYRQQHEEARNDKRLTFLLPLYKQILSDRETYSSVPIAFQNDGEVVSALRNMIERNFSEMCGEDGRRNILAEIKTLLMSLTPSEEIYISKASLGEVSRQFFNGDWQKLEWLMEQKAEKLFSAESTERKRVEKVKAWMNKSNHSLNELSDLEEVTDSGKSIYDISLLWKGKVVSRSIEAVRLAIKRLIPHLSANEDAEKPLRERREEVELIKTALDAILDVRRLLKPFSGTEGFTRDETFYGSFDSIYSVLGDISRLYNRVRDYITKKPGDAECIRLMFNNANLGAGWDKNKEEERGCVILSKGGLFYLGIMTPDAKTDFSKLECAEEVGCYKKMVYKLLPGPNKMLPKVFLLSDSGKMKYKPSTELLRRYQAKEHTKGANFNLEFCHTLIDYFKQGIAAHPDWSKFNFKFSPTSSYKSIDEFYREVETQGYSINYSNIPAEAVDRLVEDGKLCLFMLWSKDFSKASTGRRNLHTKYWQAIFSKENLEDVVIKLDGNAAVFYRPASIKQPTTHHLGEKMVNRISKDGKPLPEHVHGELFRHYNGKCGSLSAEAQEWLDSGTVTVKDVKHEITKHRRFTKDSLTFHVPITINFKQKSSKERINEAAWDALRHTNGVNVIGIDRGENNLVYVTVIDEQGRILEQKSLNEIPIRRSDGNTAYIDYNAKITQLGKDRDNARKSWSEIGNIKELKAGYLSAVVHEISRMMMKYNAVVALEALDDRFKKSKRCLDRQVYQKFETALISKLNYLVFKERGDKETGGTINGYQLTNKLEKVSDAAKFLQNGFVFYVSAGYTSTIDPSTGFTNLFKMKKCTCIGGIREFFKAFDSIKWDESRKAFAFAFDYKNFDTQFTMARTKWTVFSANKRVEWVYGANGSNKRIPTVINPTQRILDALTKAGYSVEDGFDLKAAICGAESQKESAEFFHTIFEAFKSTLQIRFRMSQEHDDYIVSPVVNDKGEFFNSNNASDEQPKDADANGAYNIARKGLMLLERIRTSDKQKPKMFISNEEWFEYAQGHHC